MKTKTKPLKSDIEQANSSRKRNLPDQENHSFPIVGIGASAGGLEALEQFLRNVLRTLAFSEKKVAATDGRWFSVCIMPYRTMEDVIAGVVITFSNITEFKRLEAELREEIERIKSPIEAGG
jgi:hypothetical protein